MAICKFQVNVEHDQVEALQDALSAIGVNLDPVADMIAVPMENLLDGIFSGADYDSLKSGTDEFFEHKKYGYRLIDDFASLSHDTRMDILHCFTSNASWTSDHQPTLDDFDIDYADQLRAEHPKAFKSA